MGKRSKPRALAENEAKAVCRLMRVSPQKLNDVASQIRGKKVDAALADLSFSRKRIAGDVKKTLESAIANAENNEGADIDELKISEVCVGEGLTMKRIRPRAKGRADRIFKRTSHITVTVSDT